MELQIIKTLLTFVIIESLIAFLTFITITYIKVPINILLKMQEASNEEFEKIFDTYYIPNFKNIFIILNILLLIFNYLYEYYIFGPIQ